MPLQKVGFNITGFQNLQPPEFNFSDNANDFMNQIPVRANEITGGYYGLAVMLFLFVFLYWKPTESMTEYADFQYSKLRGISLASGTAAIVGVFMINIGYFSNFYHVAVFLTIFAVTTIWIWKEED